MCLLLDLPPEIVVWVFESLDSIDDDNLRREIEKEAHLTRIEIWAEGEAYGQDSKFYLYTMLRIYLCCF
jgi:hypothetical protein